MTTIAKWIVSVVILAGLLAVAVAILSKTNKEAATVALYHMNQDGGAFVDKDNLQQCKDALFFPSEAGQYIRFEIMYDGLEAPPKILPAWHVEVGKDNGGLYHKNPFDTGARVSETSPESIKAWLSTL